MAQYSVKIQVHATRLPDPPAPAPARDPGADPVNIMADTIREVYQPRMPMSYLETGLGLTKEITIAAESFSELAGILAKFDGLAEEVECGNPSKKW